MEANYIEIKTMLLNELGSLDKEFKEDPKTLEMGESFYNMSKLIDVLSVFNISESEKQQFANMCFIIS